MGLLDKIKQNLEHGGIKVTIEAPQNVSRKNLSLPVTVNITNDAKVAQTIKSVIAEVNATENNSGFGMALNNSVQLGNTTNNNEMYSMQTLTVAKSESPGTFVLQPRDSNTIKLNIALSENSDASGATNKLNPTHYKYELHVKAEVEGVKLSPHSNQTLQVV